MEAQPPDPDRPEPAALEPSRLNRAFGPIFAGLIIDGVDLATFGTVGLVLGLPVGGAAGYWMGQSLGLPNRLRWICALIAGIYCTIPFTEMLPLATLVGAFVRYQEYGRGKAARPPPEGTS